MIRSRSALVWFVKCWRHCLWEQNQETKDAVDYPSISSLFGWLSEFKSTSSISSRVVEESSSACKSEDKLSSIFYWSLSASECFCTLLNLFSFKAMTWTVVKRPRSEFFTCSKNSLRCFRRSLHYTFTFLPVWNKALAAFVAQYMVMLLLYVIKNYNKWYYIGGCTNRVTYTCVLKIWFTLTLARYSSLYLMQSHLN